MTKVFFVEPVRNGLDISTAERFGQVKYLFKQNDRRASVFRTAEFMEDVSKSLRKNDFDPKVDIFAIAGSMVPVALAAIVLARKYGSIDVLCFNSVTSAYELRSTKELSHA